MKYKNILFLDGNCLFCLKSVNMLCRLDKREELHYSSLQGDAAQALPKKWRELTDEKGLPSGQVVLVERYGSDNEQQWHGADGIIRSFKLIGMPFSVLWLLYYTPKGIKNCVYKMVARNRHFIVNPNACTIPSKKFSSKFIP